VYFLVLYLIFFNNYKGSYSEIVNEAYKKGYTEPDPRDDLSGLDVARKALILSREMGGKFSLSDISIEKLYNSELESESIKDFLEKIEQSNNEINNRIEEDTVLRYIATITDDKISTELKSVNKEHPFYDLKVTDNIIAFYTKRYNSQPLVIKGPGAGVEVTASGVLSDVMQLIGELK
jgi:aspartokinase/homoserine dehydrogenase 1